jgi:AraC-like DNA-binding protein
MRSVTTGTLSAVIVRAIARCAELRGLAVPQLCARFGLDGEILRNVDARVPISLVAALWSQVPVLVHDEDFGLHVAEFAITAAQTLPAQLILASPTLGDGLRRLLRFERVIADVNPTGLSLEGDEAILDLARTGQPVPRHAAEFSSAWLVLLARRVTGKSLVPRHVEFVHPAPPRLDEHVRIFAATPSFNGEATRLVLARELLDEPSSAADAALAEILDSYAHKLLKQLPTAPDFIARVRAAALPAMAEGSVTITVVAQKLGLAPRTLQRRLADEHQTSFQALLEQLRKDLARQWLSEQQLSIAEIAFALGFADQSTFHRAFVRWTGVTPGQFRRRPET